VPRTDVERRIAAVWADVLGVGRIGLDDGFFALGGNSLQAVRVAARLAAQGLPATASHLFNAPTVAELATELTAGAPGAATGSPAPIGAPERTRAETTARTAAETSTTTAAQTSAETATKTAAETSAETGAETSTASAGRTRAEASATTAASPGSAIPRLPRIPRTRP
jgi:hypothetical protein